MQGSAQNVIGVVGGSGLYALEGLTHVQEVALDTPFGRPSDVYVTGELNGTRMVFLPRHGRGHRFTPSELNYRANIYGFKQLGVTHLISVSAVGSMKEEIHPGDIVVVDQFIDRTVQRPHTFFNEGIVAHVPLADPVCPLLAQTLTTTCEQLGVRHHRGGTYICIEGPQFSTRAESKLYRSWGVSVIGMTNMPEARLAREAEISYATLALATDYDCWHESEEDVSVEAVIAVLTANVAKALAIIAAAVPQISTDRTGSPAFGALKHAVMTDPKRVPPETWARVKLLVGPYFPQGE
ncbi:MAG: S-methyl-5'-thioadenosine phosphorylase [Myxococcota bacterium]